MKKALVNEINTFIEIYNDEIYDKDEITNIFSVYQNLNIEFIKDQVFSKEFAVKEFLKMTEQQIEENKEMKEPNHLHLEH